MKWPHSGLFCRFWFENRNWGKNWVSKVVIINKFSEINLEKKGPKFQIYGMMDRKGINPFQPH